MIFDLIAFLRLIYFTFYCYFKIIKPKQFSAADRQPCWLLWDWCPETLNPVQNCGGHTHGPIKLTQQGSFYTLFPVPISVKITDFIVAFEDFKVI